MNFCFDLLFIKANLKEILDFLDRITITMKICFSIIYFHIKFIKFVLSNYHCLKACKKFDFEVEYFIYDFKNILYNSIQSMISILLITANIKANIAFN